MIRATVSSSPFRLVVSVLCAGALAACGGGGPQKPRALPPVPVTVARAELRTMPLTVRTIGHVEPIQTVAVRPQVGGVLQDVRFAEGQNVTKGQVLCVIDSRPYEATLREVEARLARDLALARKADADVVRYSDLVKKDFVTREQYDLIKSTAESLKAIVAADQAAIDNARLQLAYCTITAPVAGRTGSLLVKAGNLVKANDDKALVVINQVRPIFVSFAVPAEHVSAVRARAGDGLEVKTSIPGEEDRPASGKLAVVDNAVDTSTSTVLLKAIFANDDERLWPGLFVDVALVLEQQRDRVVVPAAAVQTGQIGTYVFVVKDDQTAELRPVKVARQDERDAVLTEGVQAGETVVTDGQLRLVPGARVEAGESRATQAEARS